VYLRPRQLRSASPGSFSGPASHCSAGAFIAPIRLLPLAVTTPWSLVSLRLWRGSAKNGGNEKEDEEEVSGSREEKGEEINV